MATCEKSGPGYYASERYSPRYWLALCEEARTGGEYEVAIGYAHLALLLCQQVCNTFHSKASETLPQTYLDNSVWIQMSAYDHDPKNLAENETLLYFEGLKLIACQNIVADLLVLGFYAEAQAMTEFIITPTNWLVDVVEEERFRLATALEDFVSLAMAASQKEQGKTYLRHNGKLWKNPFDIDTSTKEGINRLADFIVQSRARINPKQKIQKSIGFTRSGHMPCLVSLKRCKAKDVIWTDGTFLGVTSEQKGACEYCLVVNETHPAHPKKAPKGCCQYMVERVLPSCWQQATKWYHTHGNTAEFWKQNEEFYKAIAESKVDDFGHALPLIQRLIKLVKVASEEERIHPLQYDIIPFLPSDCRRFVPWSYKRGIVDVINLLIMEGIDPFVEDFWSIRTILILWRKFGPIDFHLIAQDNTPNSDGELLANFSCIFPTYPFLMHSCDPNTRVSITPDAPTRLRLIAVKPIARGEPITISRIQYDHQAKKAMPLKERRQAFEALGVHPCQCELCTRELKEIIQRKRKAPGAPVGSAKFKDADSETYAKMLESRSTAIQAALDAMKQKYPSRAMTAEEKQRADRRMREEAEKQKHPPTESEDHSTKEADTPRQVTVEEDQQADSSAEESPLHQAMKRKRLSMQKAAHKRQRVEPSAGGSTVKEAANPKRVSGQKTADKGPRKGTPPKQMTIQEKQTRESTPRQLVTQGKRRRESTPRQLLTQGKRRRMTLSGQAAAGEEQRAGHKAKEKTVVSRDNDQMFKEVVAEYYRLREKSFEELTRDKKQRPPDRPQPGAGLSKPPSDVSTDELEVEIQEEPESSQDTPAISDIQEPMEIETGSAQDSEVPRSPSTKGTTRKQTTGAPRRGRGAGRRGRGRTRRRGSGRS